MESKTTLVRISNEVHKKLRKYAFVHGKQMLKVVDSSVGDYLKDRMMTSYKKKGE